MPTAAAAAALALLAGCSAPLSAPPRVAAPSTGTAATGSRTAPPPGPVSTASEQAAAAGGVAKVLLIVEENHGQQAALAGMPYLGSLAARYGRTTAYSAVAHPSLPNYLALAFGSTFGVADDASPSAHPLAGPTVFDAAISAGRTAAVYAESMPGPCSLVSAGSYAVKHNPWAYAADAGSRARCRAYDLPLGTTTAGALHDAVAGGTLPTVGMVVPDICHDAHDCALSTADGWLQRWLPVVMAGADFAAGRLAVVVTFDESEGGAGNTVLTVVIAPGVHQVAAGTAYTHYSWTRWAADLAGVPPPRQAAGATSLGTAFGLASQFGRRPG